MGWDYAIGWLTVLPFEITAAGITISFWRDDINIGVWIAVFLFLLVVVQIFGVRGYGEGSYLNFALVEYPKATTKQTSLTPLSSRIRPRPHQGHCSHWLHHIWYRCRLRRRSHLEEPRLSRCSLLARPRSVQERVQRLLFRLRDSCVRLWRNRTCRSCSS